MERAAGSLEQRARASFAVAYPRLWQELRRLEWDAYANGRPVDRSVVDRQVFEAASAPSGSLPEDPDGPLVERVRRRALVDHHPEVARLRDRLDERSSEGHGRSPATRRELAAAMEPDLITSIRLRNRLAIDQGAASYAHLAMAAEGLDLAELVTRLTEARQRGLQDAASLAAREGMTIESWFEHLGRVAGPSRIDTIPAARDLAGRLGCEDLFGRVLVRVDDGPLAGWAAAVSIPDDVRLLVRPARSLLDLATVFHEVGHALAYAGTRAAGFRAIPSDTQDEAMGSVMEQIGGSLLLSDGERARLARVDMAEMARLATSALFEIAIQDEPDLARERFVEWYAPLAPVEDPVTWALDSFRSIDPFRVHAYVLGRSFATEAAHRLRARLGDDPSTWGLWLREVLWAPGRRDTFAELVLP